MTRLITLKTNNGELISLNPDAIVLIRRNDDDPSWTGSTILLSTGGRVEVKQPPDEVQELVEEGDEPPC